MNGDHFLLNILMKILLLAIYFIMFFNELIEERIFSDLIKY